jgi:hypothetical protein
MKPIVSRVAFSTMIASILLTLATASFAFAKDAPSQVITWPESGSPVVRVTLGKFKQIGSIGGQRTYIVDTTVENLRSKKISQLTFSLFIFDAKNTRIGDGWIDVQSVTPGQTVKFQTTIAASGVPVTAQLEPKALPAELQPLAPPRKVTMAINSVPQGAALTVDGVPSGETPKIVQLTVGKHSLQFAKDGFKPGKFPLEVGPDDASGGSVSYELGTSAHDTFELRDGTVLTGALVSVSGMEIRVRVAGEVQTLDRNKIKRILLTERDPVN